MSDVVVPANVTVESVTVGRHFDDGKPRLELIDPSLLFGVGEILAFGSKKYGDRNWEKGIAYSRVFASVMRHLWKWFSGQNNDEESGMSHLHHAVCNLMFLIAYENRNMGDKFDDRVK